MKSITKWIFGKNNITTLILILFLNTSNANSITISYYDIIVNKFPYSEAVADGYWESVHPVRNIIGDNAYFAENPSFQDKYTITKILSKRYTNKTDCNYKICLYKSGQIYVMNLPPHFALDTEDKDLDKFQNFNLLLQAHPNSWRIVNYEYIIDIHSYIIEQNIEEAKWRIKILKEFSEWCKTNRPYTYKYFIVLNSFLDKEYDELVAWRHITHP